MKTYKNCLEVGKKYKFVMLERSYGIGYLENVIETDDGVLLEVVGDGGLVGTLRKANKYLIPMRNITRIRRA